MIGHAPIDQNNMQTNSQQQIMAPSAHEIPFVPMNDRASAELQKWEYQICLDLRRLDAACKVPSGLRQAVNCFPKIDASIETKWKTPKSNRP